MGSAPAELSADFRAASARAMSDFLRNHSSPAAAAAIEGSSEEMADGLLGRLQEELKKIDPFQSQLPLSMLLLKDAIAVVTERIQCSGSKKKKQTPVLEEFIPLKRSLEEDGARECGVEEEEKNSSKDKRNWMSSVQLWSSDDCTATKQNLRLESKENKKGKGCGNGDALLLSASKNLSPATLPFKSFPKEEDSAVPDLSLLTPGMKKSSGEEFAASTGSRASSSRGISQSDSQCDSLKGSYHHPPLQGSRKQRRCWSPELHRRFVSALQQLGGSQAATPKQIREIMQVDGLTNDEVKSHLQKYRLHTRRMAPAGNTPANQSLVVLGGLWTSQQEQYGDSSKAGSSQSNSPQGPLQFGGDSMEDDNEDDAKSENFSWKCHTQRPGKVGV